MRKTNEIRKQAHHEEIHLIILIFDSFFFETTQKSMVFQTSINLKTDNLNINKRLVNHLYPHHSFLKCNSLKPPQNTNLTKHATKILR